VTAEPTLDVPTEKQATARADKLFADLVDAVNGLAEVDWSEVLLQDPSPDASLTRQRSFVTVLGMLAHVTAAALEPTELLMAGMTEAALADHGETSECPGCLVTLPGDHEEWCSRKAG
jgi:hypothetical protein